MTRQRAHTSPATDEKKKRGEHSIFVLFARAVATVIIRRKFR